MKRDEALASAKIKYMRCGEERTVSRRSEMKLSKLIQIAAKNYAMDRNTIREDLIKQDPLVIGLQEFEKDGTENIAVIRSRGKYVGNFIGTIRRSK